MRVLVTGGAGYIGSMLVPVLLVNNFKVTVLDNFLYRQTPFNDQCLDPDFDVIRGDCRDERILKPLVHTHDIIIPLAAIVGAPACDADQSAAHSVNFGAIRSILGFMSAEQTIIVPITNSGYGAGDEKMIVCTENTPMRPISLYGHTKVAAEHAVMQRKNAISFRLATVFGMSNRMRLDLLVNDFVYRAMTDRVVVLFEGHFKRNYIHVRDVAKVFLRGIDHIMSMRGNIYNVGLSSANLSKLELCERIKMHIPNFTYLESPIGEDPDKRNYIVSNEKLESTGWRPAWTLDEGIVELSKGYRMLRNSKYGNV